MGLQHALSETRFESLPFPFKNGSNRVATDPETLICKGTEFFGSGNHVNRGDGILPQAEMQIVNMGKLQMLAMRGTLCITREEGGGMMSTLAMPYSGGIHRYREGRSEEIIAPGDIHLNPRSGGSVTVGYFSGIITTIDHRLLERTMMAMGFSGSVPGLGGSVVIASDGKTGSSGASGRFWSFMRFIDQLLGESEELPAGLGLDEQVYRLLAISLFEINGIFERVKRHWAISKNAWCNPLDELVDYIQANAHLNLTLTDLEEQSHYSARHLQNLFKEKFDCTPMQFVRRQRLTSAMEKLQTADYDATVTSIGRDCGYRFTSNFTTDFHRQFGVTPSTVLRASRGG